MKNFQIEFDELTKSYIAFNDEYTLRTAFQKIVSSNFIYYGQEALLRIYDGDGKDITSFWFSKINIEPQLEYFIILLHVSNYSLFSKGSLFINVEPNNLVEFDEYLTDMLIEKCIVLGIDFNQIVLEITERAGKCEEQLAENLLIAKDLVPIKGMRVALDDFSFSDVDKIRLENLKPEVIKFDLKSDDVSNIKIGKLSIKDSIFKLIECVETQEDIDNYLDICDLLQGFYIHKPEIYTNKYNPSY